MQNAEPDAQPVKAAEKFEHQRDIADQKPRPEHDQSAPHGSRGQRGADAADENKQNMAVFLREPKPCRDGKVQPTEHLQVEAEMDGDHAEQAETAQGVQLPDAFLFLVHVTFSLAASSSSAR